MKNKHFLPAVMAGLLTVAAGAMAQNQPPSGPAAGADGAQAVPAPQRGPAARYGRSYTPGWSLMNSKERAEHRARMRDARTAAQCREIVAQQHQLMDERAKERGRAPLPGPRRDPCAGLPG